MRSTRVINLEEIRKPHGSITVNWGNGRLASYESNIAFFTKFCLLNGLSPTAGRKFLKSKCSLNWNRDSFEGKFSALANVLDERKETLHTLNRHSLDLIVCFDGSIQNTYLDKIFTDNYQRFRFSYCPDCLAEGYHASFHEYYWLNKCPIHHQELILHSELADRSFLTFCTYIERFLSVISAISPRWPSLQCNKRISILLKTPAFLEFKSWVLSAQNKARAINAANVIQGFGQAAKPETIDEYWERLLWFHPPPKELGAILKTRVRGQQPIIKTQNNEAVIELKQVLKSITYISLKIFYTRQIMLEKRNAKFKSLSIPTLEMLKAHKQQCCCKWSLNVMGYLEPKSLYSLSEQCPYDYVAGRLQLCWGDFRNTNNLKWQYRYWEEYRKLALQLYKAGLAERSGYGIEDYFLVPVVTPLFSEALKALLDQLLYFDCLDFIESEFMWLDSIDGKADHVHFTAEMVRSFLLLDGDTNYHFRWPLRTITRIFDQYPSLGEQSTDRSNHSVKTLAVPQHFQVPHSDAKVDRE